MPTTQASFGNHQLVPEVPYFFSMNAMRGQSGRLKMAVSVIG
jgi:hypothetical protein